MQLKALTSCPITSNLVKCKRKEKWKRSGLPTSQEGKQWTCLLKLGARIHPPSDGFICMDRGWRWPQFCSWACAVCCCGGDGSLPYVLLLFSCFRQVGFLKSLTEIVHSSLCIFMCIHKMCNRGSCTTILQNFIAEEPTDEWYVKKAAKTVSTEQLRCSWLFGYPSICKLERWLSYYFLSYWEIKPQILPHPPAMQKWAGNSTLKFTEFPLPYMCYSSAGENGAFYTSIALGSLSNEGNAFIGTRLGVYWCYPFFTRFSTLWGRHADFPKHIL